MKGKRAAAVTGLFAFAVTVTADAGCAQDRLRRSLDGPVTREAVTRSLSVVPEDAGDPGGPSEVSLLLRIEFGFDSAELTGRAMRDLDGWRRR